MAVSTEVRKAVYLGDGVQTEFAFDFKVFDAVEVLVLVETDTGGEALAMTTDYAVVLNTEQLNAGGVVRLKKPAADGRLLVIASNVPYLQKAVFSNQGGFYPAAVTQALDVATVLIQQLREELRRCVRLDAMAAEKVDVRLPAPKPDYVLVWNADATKLISVSGRSVVLHPATATELGGLMVGAGLSITADGVLSVDDAGFDPVAAVDKEWNGTDTGADDE